jgi:1-deoxy-D-xylulose-5-phosphate synthase
VAIYSSFLQRGYDQFIHDVAIQNLPVMFAVDRAGIVGADGATHQGVFDLSFLRCIPNTVIMAPSNERECQLMLNTGHKLNSPSIVRYPRGNGIGELLPSVDETIELGKGVTILEAKELTSQNTTNKSIAILSFGTMLSEAKKVAIELNASLVDMRFIKPLDETLIDALNSKHDCLVTIEDNAIAGGAGSGVNEYLLAQGKPVSILNIGITDQFVKHGTQEEMHHELGLDAAGIITKIKHFIS